MNETADSLKSLFLFEGMTDAEKEQALLLCHPAGKEFRRGETLFSPQDYPHALAVITDGRCDVLRRDGDASVTIRTLNAGDCFGVVSLFSGREEYPTTVIARRQTRAVFVSREDVEAMFAAYPRMAMNLIRFLTERVEFLNDRVSAFAGPSVEKRLASWLLQNAAEGVPFAVNRKLAAETLGCGRASLYRALDSLEQKQLITLQGRNLIMNDRNSMERMIQS